MNQSFDQWAIVELFGHQRIAGRVSEQTVGGCAFVRVDVPECDGTPGYTKFYGNGAIYGMTITDEKTARAAVKHMAPIPLEAWTIENMVRALQGGERKVFGLDLINRKEDLDLEG